MAGRGWNARPFSLTRDVPTGLGWLIAPIIRKPAEGQPRKHAAGDAGGAGEVIRARERSESGFFRTRFLLLFHQLPEAAAAHVPALGEKWPAVNASGNLQTVHQ